MVNELLGVKVDFGLTQEQVLNKIEDLIKQGGSHLISTTNPFFIMEAQKDEEFKKIINASALSVPDGIGTLYANLYLTKAQELKKDIFFPLRAFILGLQVGIYGYVNRRQLGERITGVDLTYKLCELSAKKGYSIFFLGGRPRDKTGKGIAGTDFSMSEEASNVIKRLYPNVNIVGATSDFDKYEYDDVPTRDYIRDKMKEGGLDSIDIMLVAYDTLYQEKWIQRNAKEIPCTVSIGVGRTFDYIAGYMRPPHSIVDKVHLSWLYALFLQPWRYKRVFTTFPVFPLKIYFNLVRASVKS